MTYVDTITWEAGTIGAAPTVAGDILQVIGSNAYSAGIIGAVAMESTAGGYVTIPAPANACTMSFLVRSVGALTGSARIATFTDSVNTFFGSLRFHSSGVFDITDPTSTRIGATGPAWAANTLYRCDFSISGTGTSRTVRARVYAGLTSTLLWDSGDRTTTGTPSNPVARVRCPAQSLTGGVVRHDHWRRYSSATDTPGVPLVSGTVAGDLQRLTAALTAAGYDRGTVAGTLARLTGALTGRGVDRATVAGTLARITATLIAGTTDRGAVAGVLPRLTGQLTGHLEDPAVLAGALPRLVGELTGTVLLPGDPTDYALTAELEQALLAWLEPHPYAARLEPVGFTAEVLP